ncbi:MAG: putative peptidase YuxL [Fimbriimonadales bacterium]|nr:MAG: putative peptidase YuxL [Fimbriimonadales bacterium]
MKRTITIDDLFRIKLLGSPQIAPDGSQVVFVYKWIDTEKNKYFANLWRVRFGEEPQPFTYGEWSDSQPRWSPDGKYVAFISNRQKPKSQIYVIPSDGGEARPITNLEEGSIAEFAWSPDGRKIAFIYRETAPEWREQARKERETKGLSNPPRILRRAYWRLDGDGAFVDQRYHLYVVDVFTGETKQLTSDPEFSEFSPTWSPDGNDIAFISNRHPDPDNHPSHDAIYIIPADGGELRKVDAPDGPKYALRWSPDGKSFAYIGNPYPDDPYPRNDHVWRVSVEGGDAVDLTAQLDNTVGVGTLTDVREFGGGAPLLWSADSQHLYFLVSERGGVYPYRVKVDGTHLDKLLDGDFEIADMSLATDEHRLALLKGDATHPHEIFLAERTGNTLSLTPLTAFNQPLLDEVALAHPEEFEVTADDGVAVHGWLLKPPDFDPTRKYPTILMIHGGPHAMYGRVFFHEFQLHAAQGYVVAYTNPRGSVGYGEAFARAIKGDWGNRDYHDLMTVADYLASLPFVDAERMGVAGGSYGGYMTNWIVGHTNRFKAAITDRSVVNLVSMAGVSDFPMIPNRYWQGNFWDEPQKLWERSPLAYAGRITTPLLIVHSEGDLRCPISEADQLFAALRRQGKEVIYIRYPAESSHGLSRSGPPDLRRHRLEQYLAWWARWL